MKVWKILQSLEGLEESMSRYYGALHLHYADKPEVAGFFARMRDEELAHRDIVRYQQRIMFKSPESFTDLTELNEGDFDQATRAIEDCIAREPGLTFNEALCAATTLEETATEQHLRSILGRACPTLDSLMQSLGSFDEEHAARLSTFARSHGESLESSSARLIN